MPGIRAGKPRRHLRGAPQKRGRRRGGGLQTRLLQGKGTEGSSRPPPPPPPGCLSRLAPSFLFCFALLSISPAGLTPPLHPPRAAGGRRSEAGAGRSGTRPGRLGRGARRCPLSLLRRHLAGAARSGAAVPAPAGGPGGGSCGGAGAGRGGVPRAGKRP